MSPSPRNGSRLTVLLCAIGFGNTFSIGAFPALLLELARDGLADWQLGFLAGAMGLARMGVDVPAGLLVSRNLGRTVSVPTVACSSGRLSAEPWPVTTLPPSRPWLPCCWSCWRCRC